MAADVGQAYCGWAPELAEQEEAQELSVSDDDFSSFGSFKFESLDWEKRSVFRRNRCQEELEKFKTPGLVARKKAFFEERYKKIRAQKAMQENQQLILDDGGARSISNQVKDETSVHIESTGGGVLDVVDLHSEETSFEVTMHKKQSCEDMQIQNTSSTLHSSTGGWLEVNEEITDDYSLHLQDLDSDSSMLESLTRTEVIVHHSHMNIDDRDASRRPDNSELTTQLEKDSSGSDVQIHHRDTQVTGHPSLVQAELVEESQFSSHDDKDISVKNCILESNVDLATAGTVIHHANSDAVKSDDKDTSPKNCILESNVDLATAVNVIHHANSDAVKSDSKIVQEKAKSHVRKQKGNAAVTKLMKGPVSSARYGLKVDFKSQTITSQPPKRHSQQLVGKVKNTLGPNNATSDKVSRNIRSSPVASHKPLTGACSKSTIAVPVSFGMERRTRDNALNLQDTSRKAARTCSVNNEGYEDKRGSEQILERRPTSRTGRVPKLPEPLKDQKSKEPEYRRSSDQAQERRPTSRRGSVTNLPEPLNQKSKGSEKKGGSEQVQERRPTSRLGRLVNVPEPPKDRKSEGIVNQRGSEQVRGKSVPTGPMVRVAYLPEPLKDQKSRTSENKRVSEQFRERILPGGPMLRTVNVPESPKEKISKGGSENLRGSEQVRERILPGGPMLRAVNVPEPPKEKRSKGGSENLRGSEQRERALPNVRVVNVSDAPKAKISRSVNLPAQNQSNSHGGGVHRSTVAPKKEEVNEVASSRADPFAHKGKRPVSGSRSQNGTLPRQEMRPWR